MKKTLLIALALFSTIGLASCSDSSGETGEKGGGQSTTSVELTNITLTTNKETFLTGERIEISVTPDPQNANKVNGSSYKSSCYEHFYEKDGGNAVRFSKSSATANFTFTDEGNYVFWSKYCNHSSHSDTNGDVVSNKISIFVDLPESEKVAFKYDLLDDGTASVYAGKLFNTLTDVTIPTEIDGHLVSTIKNSGFSSYKNIKTLHIPTGIKKIGSKALESCSNLRYIHIADSVSSIGDYAFRYCDDSSYVFYESPNAVGSSTTVLNYINHYMTDVKDYCVNNQYLYAIQNDNKVQLCEYYGDGGDLIIPEKIDGYTIKRIANYCFYKKTSIQSLTFNTNGTLEAIGNYAFSECKTIKEVILPPGLKTIGSRAFESCSNLEFIVVPDTVSSVGDYAFKSCASNLYLLIENTSTSAFPTYTVLDYVWRYTTGVNGHFEKDGIVYGVQTNKNLCILYYNGNGGDIVIPAEIEGAKVERIS